MVTIIKYVKPCRCPRLISDHKNFGNQFKKKHLKQHKHLYKIIFLINTSLISIARKLFTYICIAFERNMTYFSPFQLSGHSTTEWFWQFLFFYGVRIFELLLQREFKKDIPISTCLNATFSNQGDKLTGISMTV